MRERRLVVVHRLYYPIAVNCRSELKLAQLDTSAILQYCLFRPNHLLTSFNPDTLVSARLEIGQLVKLKRNLVSFALPLFLFILTAYLLVPTLQKRIVSLHSKPKRLALQFAFCTIMASCVTAYFRNTSFNLTLLSIVTIGFINAFGNYCKWQAVSISLSKDSLLSIWDDVIIFSLGYFLLKERNLMNTGLWVGVSICFGVVSVFIYRDYLRKKNGKNIGESSSGTPPVFYLYVLAYSLIWGSATVLRRYWALNNVSTDMLIFGWYLGSFIGALAILAISSLSRKFRASVSPPPGSQENKLFLRDYLGILLLSMLIISALIFNYWLFNSTPAIIVSPILLISEMVFPTLIGLYIFNERRDFASIDWFLLVLGFAGAVIIVLNK